MNSVAPFKHRPKKSKTEDESNYRKYDGEDTNWVLGEVPQSMSRKIGADRHICAINHGDDGATEVPKKRMAGDAMDRPEGHDGEPNRTKGDQVKGQRRLVDPTIESRIIWF
jgi:hypothetical protein